MKDNQKVWIKGDKNRGKEVIETLENLGGVNKRFLEGYLPNQIYFISHDSYIFCTEEDSEFAKFVKELYQKITLPEQWEKGDILINKNIYLFCVFDGFDNDDKYDNYFATPLSVDKGDYNYYGGTEVGVYCFDSKDYRKATEDEIAQFHELLHKHGKDWDEKNKQLVSWMWKPKRGDIYYYITAKGSVLGEYYQTDYDEKAAAFGNCFKTREEAIKFRDKIKDILKTR